MHYHYIEVHLRAENVDAIHELYALLAPPVPAVRAPLTAVAADIAGGDFIAV